MDPLTLATTFSTIISLLVDFKNEYTENNENIYDDFMLWLDSQHEEIKSMIIENSKTVIGIKSLLNEDRNILANKLEQIDRKLALLLSKDELFYKLVAGIRPDCILSEQAIYLLQQIEDSGGSNIITMHIQQALILTVSDSRLGGFLKYDDERFIFDDLNTLVENNFLRIDYNKKGDPVYIYTRLASEFVKSISRNN